MVNKWLPRANAALNGALLARASGGIVTALAQLKDFEIVKEGKHI
jgi:hypothetical protein